MRVQLAFVLECTSILHSLSYILPYTFSCCQLIRRHILYPFSYLHNLKNLTLVLTLIRKPFPTRILML